MVRTDLTREEVERVLKEALESLAGGNCPENIDPGMVVLANWDLDSEDGVEIACDLSALLGVIIPDEDNPLIEDGSNRRSPRTFGEVVDYLLALKRE